MEKYKDYFTGKKITVMGLGLLGRGIGDTAFLAECGAELIVTDKKSAEALAESLAQLSQYPNIRYTLGEHKMEDFENRDMILVSADVPFDSPYTAYARERGVRLVQSAALFAELTKIPVIGVTGTRGKSTVTHMIHHVLTTMTDGAGVLLGGNVRGVSNLQLLKEVQEESIAVMELDSWQLQGFGWAEMSPQIAVFGTFMEDHMNYYHGSMDAYFADKANIFRYQEEGDVLVTTREVFERAESFARKTGFELVQEVRLVDTSILPDDCILAMPGEHNRLNAALAYEALKAVGLEDEEIFEGLATFPGVPGRLEFLGEYNGAKIYNDNNATTPTATKAGIEALANPEGTKNVILIMGGAGKELDMTPLTETIPTYCKAVVLLPGTGTDVVKEKIEGEIVDSLEAGIDLALTKSEPGDVILFSPAFASFGLFKNEYDRGDRFVTTVMNVLKEQEEQKEQEII